MSDSLEQATAYGEVPALCALRGCGESQDGVFVEITLGEALVVRVFPCTAHLPRLADAAKDLADRRNELIRPALAAPATDKGPFGPAGPVGSTGTSVAARGYVHKSLGAEVLVCLASGPVPEPDVRVTLSWQL